MALTQAQHDKARRIIAAAPQPLDIKQLAERDAVLVLRHLHGFTQAQAEETYAFETGQTSGDVVESR